MMFGSQWSEKADTRIWRAFGKVNLRLVELVGVGSETSYYWFNWSSAKRLDPQRISFLFLFLILFNCSFLFLFSDLWFVFIIGIMRLYSSLNLIYLRIFLIITLHHLIHMRTFTIFFLHISCCSYIDAKFKRSSSIYYILDLPVSTHFNGDIILYDVMVVMKLWSFSFKQVILILVT